MTQAGTRETGGFQPQMFPQFPTQGQEMLVYGMLHAITAHALASGDAVIIVGSWQELERARRHVAPWRDLIITTAVAVAKDRLAQWAESPDGPLFCTPAILTQVRSTVGKCSRGITVVTLSSNHRTETALSQMGRSLALRVIDANLMVRTWSRIDVAGLATVEVAAGQ